ncbi:MAG: bifunctional UDP-N-acetylglucosamine diphosphorylase/glucosamine-1-phosphate N-acetyltransferase GlmU [Pseudomonadota bacterium]|nr:bifunctional UDP-N-acetylglucosamine diphosphorylase/glucosamine-1-phosphate N-acetyltransferase GlmU [Pseudomonadota bacterium]
MTEVAALILAAGKGKRMNSFIPKVLHAIWRKPILGHVISLANSLKISRLAIVTGYKSDLVESYLEREKIDATLLKQDKQLGTGNAVQCAENFFKNFKGNIIILYGDVPFIKQNTIQKMLKLLSDNVDFTVLGFKKSNPTGYGRLIIDSRGYLEKIIEEKSASDAQKKNQLCNSGVLCGKASTLFSLLSRITNNNTEKEYFLTDIFKLASDHGLKSVVLECEENEAKGINSRGELAEAEINFQNHLRRKAFNSGVTLIDPPTVYFSHDTVLEPDVIVHPNVVFGENVEIKTAVEIFSFSHLEGCKIFSGAKIGPFARIRPDSTVKESAKVGNFVEIKNSTLGVGAKANHLSYIGDAKIGDKSNVGAGTVFCNFDGLSKNVTKVGKNSFVGSNSSLIAPLSIGKNTIIGAGSVITTNIPDHALGLSRQKQKIISGVGARKLRRQKKN